MDELEISLEPLTTTWSAVRDIPNFKSANEFSLHIESLACKKKITYMDAVLEFCEEYMIEPVDITPKINKSLREKIENDFRDLNYLPKVPQIEM